jgi:hypothetical protein
VNLVDNFTEQQWWKNGVVEKIGGYQIFLLGFTTIQNLSFRSPYIAALMDWANPPYPK